MQAFIDTNVYLSFYSLGSDDLEQLRKLVAIVHSGRLVLYLPDQVRDEFARNRENKVSEALKALKEQETKGKFPTLCKDYEEYEEMKSLQASFLSKLNDLQVKVREDIGSGNLKADGIIDELFRKATRIETTSCILAAAEQRVRIGNPPGKDRSFVSLRPARAD